MKTRTKALLLALCAVVLVVATVFGTIAYLTDTEEVVNTFTVGSVAITLDETDVNEYGEKDGDTRVAANTYKLLPGHTYIKDPTVTVVQGSEPSYIRLLVTVSDMTNLKEAIPQESNGDFYGTFGNDTNMFLLQQLVTGWDANTWACYDYTENTVEGVTSGTYEFRYVATVDARTEAKTLDALFDEIVVPGNLTNDQIAKMNQVSITIVANAIQADGFTDANAAWEAFGNQNS